MGKNPILVSTKSYYNLISYYSIRIFRTLRITPKSSSIHKECDDLTLRLSSVGDWERKTKKLGGDNK